MGMIFRKPYGFLIKRFKLIHLILTGFFIYLAVKVGNVLDFYNDFILGTASKLEAISYVDNMYLWVVFASILICIVVYSLLQYKKKPRTLYIVLIIFLIVIASIISISYGGLKAIYTEFLDKKTLLLYRDLLKILIIFQYASVLMVLVRGLGFDIKKFDFVKDMHELNLDISDEEEVELTLGNTNTLQRKFFRWLRELKYYYFENKLFIWIFILLLIFIGGSTLFVSNEIVNKVYQEGETFSSDEFQFNILESYITNKSNDGNIILKDDSSFVILEMIVLPKSGQKKLNSGNFVLHIDYNTYKYDNYYASRFSDLGAAYKEQDVKGQKTYLFIFKVSNEDILKDMTFVYAGDKEVKLSPINLDVSSDSLEYKMGESINLAETVLKSGSFKVTDYEIKDSFPYSYQYEVGGQTFTSQYYISSVKGNVLNIKIESNLSGLNNYSFLSNYATIKYQIGDEVFVTKFDNKSPGNYKEGLYLGVNGNIKDADSIWFDIVIRDKSYVYKIR